MAKQVSLHDLGKVDFAPQAVVRKPIEYFSKRLFTFERDCDDLDEYESAFFTIDDLAFALIHYRGNPEDRTTIYFARDAKREAIPSIVQNILREFDLSMDALEWISPQ